MKLPNYEHALIPERKIMSYLLDETHPTGKHKAIFFRRFGFSMDEWKVLAEALMAHAATYELAGTLQTREGTHFVVDGKLLTPDRRDPNLRSVWAIDVGSETPRFITAYPLEK